MATLTIHSSHRTLTVDFDPPMPLHALLEQAGVDPANIAVCDECTACQPDRFWSHRKMGNNRGSMAAAIQLL